MLLSWQHFALPFLQLRVRPRVKQKICAALIKLVSLKGICINALIYFTFILAITHLIASIFVLIFLFNNEPIDPFHVRKQCDVFCGRSLGSGREDSLDCFTNVSYEVC